MAVLSTITGIEFELDDDDALWAQYIRWGFNLGYIRATSSRYEERFLHRIIMDAPKDVFVDHKSRNTLDNRKANLRKVTHSLSGHNRVMPARSLPRGVSYHRGRFQASIRIDSVLRYLGRYDTPEEAYAVYQEAAYAHHGEYAP